MFIRHRNAPSAPTSNAFSPITEETRIRQKLHDWAGATSSGRATIFKHPEVATYAAQQLIKGFQGDVIYSVKSNPSPDLLHALSEGGICSFDVASIEEISLVRQHLPSAKLRFMNPIKSRSSIREACDKYQVGVFAVDTQEELDKVVAETSHNSIVRSKLAIIVRIAVEHRSSKIDLSKPGADEAAAVGLLQEAEKVARRVGVTFHVGSQCMDPHDYWQALEKAHSIAARAHVTIHIVDVGGGLPVAYPGMSPPKLENYFITITNAVQSLPLFSAARLWIEPGRALCADYNHIVLRVVQRKTGNRLYVNDGVFGNFRDAEWRYEVELLRPSKRALKDFSFYGPTCDGHDFMPGPFRLPGDVSEGDPIWVKRVGAYSLALSTSFNFGVSGGHEAQVKL